MKLGGVQYVTNDILTDPMMSVLVVDIVLLKYKMHHTCSQLTCVCGMCVTQITHCNVHKFDHFDTLCLVGCNLWA